MKRILVIDDDADIVEIIRAILELKGYRVIKAFNGKEGIEKAEKHNPDLILLDIMMPEMDGWEVCRRLKGSAKTSNIPVVIISAKVKEEEKDKVIAKGAVDCIAKPFLPNDFLKRIGIAILSCQ